MKLPFKDNKFRKLVPKELYIALPVFYTLVESITPKPRYIEVSKYKASYLYQSKKVRVIPCYKPISKIIVHGR